MIITRTPFRVSMFGGGTDYPGWYREHGGAVLSTTIDKYCYITARHLPPFFEHRFRVVYSQIESANTIEEIEHPSVRATLNFMNLNRGIEIHHDGDLPARSGMGSSSSFTVGLLNALHALNGHMATKEQLANESIQIEQDILKETVGSQDQVNAAYGGFNHITFHQSGEISVRPVIVPSDRLEELTSHLMLFYTGIKRTADKVAGSYVPSLEAKRRQLRILRDMVEEALSILCGHGPIKEYGELLHEGWLAKPVPSAARLPEPAEEDSCCSSYHLGINPKCARNSKHCCTCRSTLRRPAAKSYSTTAIRITPQPKPTINPATSPSSANWTRWKPPPKPLPILFNPWADAK